MILIQNYISVPNLFNNIKEIPYRVYFNHCKQKLLIFKNVWYYATFKMKKFSRSTKLIQACKKLITCIGLQAEQIFLVNYIRYMFF